MCTVRIVQVISQVLKQCSIIIKNEILNFWFPALSKLTYDVQCKIYNTCMYSVQNVQVISQILKQCSILQETSYKNIQAVHICAR